jgi:hypothetical protein
MCSCFAIQLKVIVVSARRRRANRTFTAFITLVPPSCPAKPWRRRKLLAEADDISLRGIRDAAFCCHTPALSAISSNPSSTYVLVWDRPLYTRLMSTLSLFLVMVGVSSSIAKFTFHVFRQSTFHLSVRLPK